MRINFHLEYQTTFGEELVLNISKQESESDNEINELFEEFSRVTSSVKAYN